ncbi:hypothetical protein BpHYR1_036392 [Brachionus plicatilis]|uniref:Uncharacterized protein n=1 Tax=Brachionus plicatilis TaxID=10195 RepID=A0A3M7SP67_BRAPC|nr:hypothetical protein BpHYR1_036392 [Brachionus plicatilis]
MFDNMSRKRVEFIFLIFESNIEILLLAKEFKLFPQTHKIQKSLHQYIYLNLSVNKFFKKLFKKNDDRLRINRKYNTVFLCFVLY